MAPKSAKYLINYGVNADTTQAAEQGQLIERRIVVENLLRGHTPCRLHDTCARTGQSGATNHSRVRDTAAHEASPSNRLRYAALPLELCDRT